ncbi:alpha-ketoacid dehydrogenase subunit alpha/beta [Tropicimonas marinistellae]|uniref:alpha-ketoacid dehydrogenase subunit alpha/beta n=1 Tax=Tropicimonas marinistellae TaxID=1739787 RepID=UPI0008300219|nr:alpha-ketoacid dehydrogenase subunit alpha/beta [Tropicimonas marinistellae]
MPKEIPVEPAAALARAKVTFSDIPVCDYDEPIAEERERRGDANLREILRHMLLVREFETMLASYKSTGAYRGIEFAYKGPAHLSIGQEGAAVGAALALSPDDHIFGSHRSHGEFIAKGLSAIATLDETALDAIMDEHQHGALRDTVKAHLGGDGKVLAENFLLLGVLAEIFMRANGFNGGMGGSMHAFFPPFGAYPNNALVSGSSAIATGAALYKKLADKPGIAVANIGDGATGCGVTWEAMNFAAMAQYDTLWSDPRGGRPPVLFFCNNNFYGMGGQTSGETMGWERLSRLGAGVNPEQMHAETVDGTNPLAVADAVARKRELLLEGKGPALLDVQCYRSTGHSTTDANAYRSRDELKAWAEHDPIVKFAATLTAAGVMSEAEVDAMRESVGDTIGAVTRAAVDPAIAPIVDVPNDPTLIGDLMFNHEAIDLPEAEVPVLKPPAQVANFKSIGRKARFGLDDEGRPLSGMRAITLRDGLTEAVLHHMLHDESLIAYGEDVREWGGAYGVYRGLSDIFPHQRLFNAPISEAAIVSTAVGYAMEGGRALVELMYTDFLGRAGDEVFNQMAKWQGMSAGQLKVPVVLRLSVGSKYGAQHSQDWSAFVTHVPGLKVVYPATPYDAKGLLASALSSNDPVVFFESQRIYDQVEVFRAEGVPSEYFRIPLGQPDIKRLGNDVTVLTIGPSLYPAMAAAEELATQGIETEVIDARTLVPFDYDPVLSSVKKTGHLVVVTEAAERGSFAMTLSANVARFGFSDLKAPPRVLGSPNWIVPGAEMESTFFPQAHDIVDLVTTEFFPARRANRRGVRSWDDIDLARRAL